MCWLWWGTTLVVNLEKIKFILEQSFNYRENFTDALKEFGIVNLYISKQ